MKSTAARIVAVLADAALDEIDQQSSIEELCRADGWDRVCDALLAILEDATRSVHDWAVTAAVFWGAVLDGRPVPADRLIALLYVRLPKEDGAENNLAWSIASNLKGRSYLSDYDPLSDPDIQRELDRLR